MGSISASQTLRLGSATANPRIDRIVKLPQRRVITMAFRLVGRTAPDRLKVLRGTPTPGAELGNLLGAARMPPGAQHVADVLIPRRV